MKTLDEILEEIKPTNVFTMLMGLISSNSHLLLLHFFIRVSYLKPSTQFLIEIVRNCSRLELIYSKKETHILRDPSHDKVSD